MSRLGPRAMAGRVALLFGVAAVCAAGLVVAWWRHGSVQVTGVLLAVALACLAAGIGLWANRLTPQGPYQQRRPSHVYPEEVEEAGEDLAEGAVALVAGLGLLAIVCRLLGEGRAPARPTSGERSGSSA